MNLWDKAQILRQLARARIAWLRYDTSYPSPVPDNPKFMTARAAASLIGDGDVVADSGIGGQQRASILYWAIREAFESTGHPAGITVINVGGHGGRGKVPGTLDELGQPGLCTRLITSHFETFHNMLDLAAARECELQCVPLGVMAQLFAAQGQGRSSRVSRAGVGTFLDPRVGRGSPVTPSTREQLVRVAPRGLRYHIPAIDAAIFNVPAADRRGNLYARGAAVIGESRELARAAKRNNGAVIANVGRIADEGCGEIFLPAGMVDAVVYHPDTEQSGAVFHREPWPVFTTESDTSIAEGMECTRLINSLIGVAPRRSVADAAMARLAATTLLTHVPRGAHVNIGVGHPEEVCRQVFESGRLADVTFLVETGVVGGLPASGAYFGAALCPERIISTAEMFELCHERLDATCLGALQVDGEGNVNVSKRGHGAREYVGPGGLIDLTEAARTIVFVTSWMHGGRVDLDGRRMHIARRGRPKFVRAVDEVTFNGARARRAGKDVFYVTHVGVFRLTARGMELIQRMPGIDVAKDIVEFSPMRIVLPASGRIPIAPASVVTGDGYRPPRPAAAVEKGRETAG